MALGEILQELRKDRGLDQVALGKIINVTKGTISNYESDTHSPSFESLIKLAEFFDVSIDYLLGHTKLRISLTKFNDSVCENKTVGGLINDIVDLSPENLQALVDYVELLKLRK